MADNDRFQRWQKVTIDQFSYTINLMLTFTIAAIGYWFVLLSDVNFVPSPTGRCAMILSLMALTLSATCGLSCSISRLQDFRATARRAGGRDDAPSKNEVDELGRMSWALFYCQVPAFGMGIAALGVAVLLTFGGKLA